MKGRIKKIQKKKDYTVISIMIFVVAFFTIFAIRPSINLIVTLLKEKAEYESVNQRLETKIQEIIQAQTNYMYALNKKETIDQAIPDSHRLDQINKTISQQLELSTFNIQKLAIYPRIKNTLVPINIDISFKSEYDQLTSFLKALYKNPRIFRIRSLNIALQDQQGSESAKLRVNTNLETYYLYK